MYSTSRSEDPLQNLFITPLIKILKEMPEKVSMTFIGARPINSEILSLPNVKYFPPTRNYQEFIRLFYEGGYDIGLAPLEDDEFHNSKTNNKYREYGACGIAGIYSDTELYRDSIIDRSNGLLTPNNPESWSTALRELIGSKELRKLISENSNSDVRLRFSNVAYLDGWRASLDNAIRNSKEKKTSQRKKVRKISIVETPGIQGGFDYSQELMAELNKLFIPAEMHSAGSQEHPDILKLSISTKDLSDYGEMDSGWNAESTVGTENPSLNLLIRVPHQLETTHLDRATLRDDHVFHILSSIADTADLIPSFPRQPKVVTKALRLLKSLITDILQIFRFYLVDKLRRLFEFHQASREVKMINKNSKLRE